MMSSSSRLALLAPNVPNGVTWSPIAINPSAILSNGRLTITGQGGVGYQSVRATNFIGLGVKRYWEVRLDVLGATGSSGVGVANASNVFNDGSYIGKSNNSIGWFDDGTVIRNDVVVATLNTPVVTNTICLACIPGSKLWMRVDGGNWNNDVIGNQNPAANLGGIDISTLGDVAPACNVTGTSGPSQLTGKFRAPFSFTIPSGFSGF